MKKKINAALLGILSLFCVSCVGVVETPKPRHQCRPNCIQPSSCQYGTTTSSVYFHKNNYAGTITVRNRYIY